MPTAYTYVPAARRRVSLITILAGATGSGKTLTALLLARGLVGGRENDHKIKAIDSESGRLLFYAPAEGEKPGDFTFGFMYGEIHAPFTPEAYGEAIVAADTPDTEVIIVDSFSHVWNGDGGCDDIHEDCLDRMMKGDLDNYAKRQAMGPGAWKEPKLRHKRLVSRMLQCRAHLIICLRAEEKMLMESVVGDDGRKKTIVTPAKDRPVNERWGLICEKKLPFEATLSLLLVPDKPGYPIPLKLMEQNRSAVPLDRQVGEKTGLELAAWARGGAAKGQNGPAAGSSGPSEPLADLPAAWDHWTDEERGENRATKGTKFLEAWWKTVAPGPKKVKLGEKLTAWKATAATADTASSSTSP
jgi:DNA polymerase III delta prime subunit